MDTVTKFVCVCLIGVFQISETASIGCGKERSQCNDHSDCTPGVTACLKKGKDLFTRCHPCRCRNPNQCLMVNNTATCICNLTVTGDHCECPLYIASYCSTTMPCQNGGTCIDGPMGTEYTCNCKSGWTGKDCQQPLLYSYIFGYSQNFGNLGSPKYVVSPVSGTASIYVTTPFTGVLNHQRNISGQTVFSLANTYESKIPGIISNKAVEVTSDKSLIVFSINYHGATADGSFVSPESQLGIDYVIATNYRPSNFNQRKAFFLIIGTVNDTSVTIEYPTGSQETIQIDRLDTYMQTAATLTGTFITATAPVYVHSGHNCPHTTEIACDHLQAQMLPIPFLGTEHVISYMAPRPHFYLEIVAAHNDTDVYVYDTVGLQVDFYPSMMRGARQAPSYVNSRSLSVISSKPVLVTQYGYGEGGMMVVPSIDKFKSLYNFLVPNGFDTPSRLTVVIADNYDTNGLRLDDDTLVPTASISITVPSHGTFTIIHADVTVGVHTLSHTGDDTVFFGAWLYGTKFEDERGEYASWLGML